MATCFSCGGDHAVGLCAWMTPTVPAPAAEHVVCCDASHGTTYLYEYSADVLRTGDDARRALRFGRAHAESLASTMGHPWRAERLVDDDPQMRLLR